MILIVTNARDVTADFLIEHLVRERIDFFRLNTEEVPQLVSVELQCDRGVGARLTKGSVSLSLETVTSVWWRRPVTPALSPAAPEQFRSYLENEAGAAVGGLLRTISGLWVNHPEVNATASFKLYQLARAFELGWQIPRTVVTSRPEAARAFVRQLTELPVVKPIDDVLIEAADGESFLAYARQLQPEEVASASDVAVCPVLLQERVPKLHEYRVTVVGDCIFATTVGVRARGSEPVDWRLMPEDALEYAVAQLPADVERRCRDTALAFGLRFAALDVIETPNGDFVFLEVNPNGQWAWLEMRTGQPIRAALAALLCRGRPCQN